MNYSITKLLHTTSMHMHTPSQRQLWSALIGKTLISSSTVIAVGIIMAIVAHQLGFDQAWNFVMGAVFGAIAAISSTITTHRFLVTSFEVDRKKNELILYGKQFDGKFRIHSRRISLAGMHKTELLPRTRMEIADELHFVDQYGLTEEVKVVPGCLTQEEVRQINVRVPVLTRVPA